MSMKYTPFVLASCMVTTIFLVTPSAFYSKSILATYDTEMERAVTSHFRQYCNFEVPPIFEKPLETEKSILLYRETAAAYRLCYEVIV